ncbi:MAG: tetratricopeptide repeat protein [Prevotella sp.]|nr:tetratricopeptide repeat protein [Bacteroides sp.]MCM1366621.1 tetratricopeptide repeat protein [Prevotella sp.]MCM1436986.1 tetratricopeptide repeat protein [Prevotella sp.]
MKNFILLFIVFVVAIPFSSFAENKEKSHSTRKERKYILNGNKLYKESKYLEAAKEYKLALKENPSSAVGTYNLALSNIRLASQKGVKEEDQKKYEEEGKKLMKSVADLGNSKPELASRAWYNLGNVSFNSEDYQSALEYYKNALRLNPNDNDARRNLRITQLKLKNNNQNKDNKNKNNDQNKEKKEKEKEKEKEQPKPKEEDKNKEQKEQQPQNQQISDQTADQILKAMENKEAQTRNRVMNPQKNNSRPSRKNW